MSDRQKTLPTRVVGWFNTAKKEDLKLLFPILRDIYKRRTTEEEEPTKRPKVMDEPRGTNTEAPKKRHRRTKVQIEEDKKKAAGTAGTAAFDG